MANQAATRRLSNICEAVTQLMAYAGRQGLTGEGLTDRDVVEVAAGTAAFSPRVSDLLGRAPGRWWGATASERRYALKRVRAGNAVVIQPEPETEREAAG